MANDRERLTKVLALAMHPQTVPQEALAAFRRARDLIKANPDLAHPPQSQKPAPPPPQTTYETTITQVHPDWILVLVGNLSLKAYELDLKSKITFDFMQQPVAVNVVCDGLDEACLEFQKHVQWFIDYVNRKIRESSGGR
jgi:hypothetical protein